MKSPPFPLSYESIHRKVTFFGRETERIVTIRYEKLTSLYFSLQHSQFRDRISIIRIGSCLAVEKYCSQDQKQVKVKFYVRFICMGRFVYRPDSG